jgi:hypothetical protein
MKAFCFLFQSLLVAWLLAACTTDPAPEPTPEPALATPQKGYATGRILDTGGKPLANAEIVVNNTQFYNSNILGRTDANGKYKLQLTPGSWYVRGTVKVSYDNQTYTIDLHPETEGAFAGTEGAVRNLQWKLTGAKPTEFGGGGYYGGLVEVYGDMVGGFFDTEAVELTLEPTGPLVDGSTGKTLVRKLVGGIIGQTLDVPLGRYRITARYLPTGQALVLRMRNKGAYQSSLTNSFEPAYAGATGSYKLTLEGRLP